MSDVMGQKGLGGSHEVKLIHKNSIT